MGSQFRDLKVFDTPRIVCKTGSGAKRSGVRLYVCLSVCPIIRQPHAAAAGLLLSAVPTKDIDRLQRPQHGARGSSPTAVLLQ